MEVADWGGRAGADIEPGALHKNGRMYASWGDKLVIGMWYCHPGTPVAWISFTRWRQAAVSMKGFKHNWTLDEWRNPGVEKQYYFKSLDVVGFPDLDFIKKLKEMILFFFFKYMKAWGVR